MLSKNHVIAAIILCGVTAAGVATMTVVSSHASAASASPPISEVIDGSPSQQGRQTEPHACPDSMAHVGGSCVDKWEGALVEGSEPFSPFLPPNGHDVRAISREGVVPQAHISMVEAQKACAASNKRLCRADEWIAACKGPSTMRYPYGEKHIDDACNDTGRASPMMLLHQGEITDKTLNDPMANQQPNTLMLTGEAAQCTNAYGVHDMVGNVHEWTDDGSFRGGFYLDTKQNGEGCDYKTTAHAPSYYDYSTGFRCCADEGAASLVTD